MWAPREPHTKAVLVQLIKQSMLAGEQLDWSALKRATTFEETALGKSSHMGLMQRTTAEPLSAAPCPGSTYSADSEGQRLANR